MLHKLHLEMYVIFMKYILYSDALEELPYWKRMWAKNKVISCDKEYCLIESLH